MAVLSPSLRIYKRTRRNGTVSLGPLSDKMGTCMNRPATISRVAASARTARCRHDVRDLVPARRPGACTSRLPDAGRDEDRTATHGVSRAQRIDRSSIRHSTRVDDVAQETGTAAQSVIQQPNAAADRNDADAFLALSSPEARAISTSATRPTCLAGRRPIEHLLVMRRVANACSARCSAQRPAHRGAAGWIRRRRSGRQSRSGDA